MEPFAIGPTGIKWCNDALARGSSERQNEDPKSSSTRLWNLCTWKVGVFEIDALLTCEKHWTDRPNQKSILFILMICTWDCNIKISHLSQYQMTFQCGANFDRHIACLVAFVFVRNNSLWLIYYPNHWNYLAQEIPFQ